MQAPAQRLACELRAVSLPRTPAARGHARTRQAAAGRVPAAGSGRAAACRQVWTHRSGWDLERRAAGMSQGTRDAAAGAASRLQAATRGGKVGCSFTKSSRLSW